MAAVAKAVRHQHARDRFDVVVATGNRSPPSRAW